MVNSNDVDLDKILEVEPEATVEQPPERPLENATEEKNLEAEASLRAQDRIRELAADKKRLEEQLAIKNQTSLDTFVNSIQDEPSRELLKTYSSLLKQELQSQFSPVVDEYQSNKFEIEYAKLAGNNADLAAHKDEIRKDYLRNPSQSLKSIVGERLVDIQSAKIKPIEDTPSAVNRGQKTIDADTSKDDLYAILEQRPPLI